MHLLIPDPHAAPFTPSTNRKRKFEPLSPPASVPASPVNPTFAHSPSPPNQAPSSLDTEPVDPADHLRLWFLDHLSDPYPSAEEKDALAILTGLPRNKIDSDMTNWRRRAGWTEVKDKFARGDKHRMKQLIERVDEGREQRQEVCEAVERIKVYLERREEESVGDWVHDVSRSSIWEVNPEVDTDPSFLKWPGS